MKRYLLASVASLVLATSSFAADLASRKSVVRPVAAISPATWGGFYIGGNVGYAWTGSSFTHLETGLLPTSEAFSNNPNSFLGGAQIGARYQLQPNLYAGVEASYLFRNADAQTRTDLDPALPRYRLSKVGDIWSISGNLGYAFGDYLAYAKAGYASTKLEYKNIVIADGEILGQSKSQVGGYVLGAGLEYAWTKNVSLGLEYNYYNFSVGDQQQYAPAGGAVDAITANNDLSSHVAAAKINYRF